ncbi:MAG: hypothetical protein LBV56_22230 [Delftia acidovorans]|jgi:hypothetical protein|nr:hypothetical protein [Delftia acidovorans]
MVHTRRFRHAPTRCTALRAQRPQRVHGVPTAFISLCGFTALLSAAVRKA